MGFVVGNGVRVWLVTALLISSVLLCSSRNLLSENEEMKVTIIKARELIVTINDYDEPSANRGHDPPSARKVSGSGKNIGRRG